MATKNLARTVIEGGRHRGNTWERRHSNGEHRTGVRQALRGMADGEALLLPKRTPVHRSFADKLSPAERWLDRQVGRPWDKVRGELFDQLDTRTLAGRHIVFDHMLPWVLGDDRFGGHYRKFVVDRHGILRRAPAQGRARQRAAPLPCPMHDLAAWLRGRRVGERGSAIYWFVATAAGAWRQERRMDADDAARWRSLPAWFRERHDPAALLAAAGG